MHRALGDPRGLRQGADRPLSGVARARLQGLLQQRGNPVIVMRARAAGPHLAVQAGQALAAIAAPPQRYQRDAGREAFGNRGVSHAIRRQQEHLRAPHEARGQGPRAGEALELGPLGGRQGEGHTGPTATALGGHGANSQGQGRPYYN